MAEEDRYARRRTAVVAAVGVAVALLFVQVAVLAGSVLIGVAAVAGTAGLAWWFVSRERSRTETAMRDAPGGVVAAHGVLDFRSVPKEWRDAARLASSPLTPDRMPGLHVTVRADGGTLTVEKRRVFGTGSTPFTLRVPLAAVTEVHAGAPQVGLMGSSLIFRLAEAEDLVVDVVASRGLTGEVAQRFSDAAESARWGSAPGPFTMDITTGPPPPRLATGRAVRMVLPCLLPFAVAMAGAVDGPFAAVAATTLIIVAVGLVTLRPPWLGRVLAVGLWITAASFVIDTMMTGQPARLVGTVCCVALARWLSAPTPGSGES